MSPNLTINYSQNGLEPNAISDGESFGAKISRFITVFRSYLKHLLIGQFVAWVASSARGFGNYSSRVFFASGLSAFRYFVRHVVGVCSDKEVKWVAAVSVIAVVAYVVPNGNLSSCFFKHKAVRSFSPQLTVAVPQEASIPWPAFIESSDSDSIPNRGEISRHTFQKDNKNNVSEATQIAAASVSKI